VNGIRHSILKRVIALVLCIGALPFLNYARIYAGEDTLIEDEEVLTSTPVNAGNKWLDDYHRHIGFTYGADVTLNANYLWRGLNAGGLCLQPSANVGYGGLYAKAWFSVGTTDWAFTRFQPEFDFIVGFARWGLDATLVYIHNFNCGFFDFANYADKGNRLELNVRYTISKKIPLTFAWGTRVAASDCYLNAAGEIVRAYSSYAEISYTQALRDGWSVFGAIGVTPWKGCYNPNGAALQNIEVRIRKDWDMGDRCGLMVQGQIAVSPMAMVHVINPNITFGVYLK
jgi:hypothetical protein